MLTTGKISLPALFFQSIYKISIEGGVSERWSIVRALWESFVAYDHLNKFSEQSNWVLDKEFLSTSTELLA